MQPSALLALQAAVQGHSDKFAEYLDSSDGSSEVRRAAWHVVGASRVS